jgi:hypothetical protein
MIILPPPLKEEKDKLEEERNVFEESEIVELEQRFELDHAGGLRLDDNQYIIDPDFQEMLGIDNFEDLIKTRR